MDSLEDRSLIVFHTPETEETAKSIVALQPDCFQAGSIRWEKFDDGFPNLFIENVESIYGKHVAFVCSFLRAEMFFSQLSIMYTLPRYLVKSMTIVLPYFPTGTMERVDEEGQVATAQTLARLLSSAPLCVGGPTKLVVYDIHTLQNRFYFTDNLIPLLVTATPLLRHMLSTRHAEDTVVIAFPDDGAFKRFGSKFEPYPIVICSKVREGPTKRIVKIKDGESFVPGAHVFIVDDLVQTGGTLIECKNVLFDAGAAKVSAYVTHAVFPRDSWQRFTKPAGRPFEVFYTTDSCPDVARAIRDKPPFCVLPLAPSIVDNLLKFVLRKPAAPCLPRANAAPPPVASPGSHCGPGAARWTTTSSSSNTATGTGRGGGAGRSFATFSGNSGSGSNSGTASATAGVQRFTRNAGCWAARLARTAFRL